MAAAVPDKNSSSLALTPHHATDQNRKYGTSHDHMNVKCVREDSYCLTLTAPNAVFASYVITYVFHLQASKRHTVGLFHHFRIECE
jgi:hypothetical protein